MNHATINKLPILKIALHSLLKCNPLTLFHNPVIFITEIGAIVTSFEAIYFGASAHIFGWQISLWLWLTVLFSNIAETLAEFQNKATAEAIKKARVGLNAHKKLPDGSYISVSSLTLRKDDLCVVKSSETIPADGQIVEGAAAIDESSFTGEPHPVIRQANSDHDAVIAGTKVLSDEITIRVGADPGHGYLDKLVTLIEGSKRKKSQSEISLSLLLSSLTLIFLFVIITFQLFGLYYNLKISITSQVAFLICLIPTTIAGLLSAIGIAGINRLFKQNVLALSGQAIEAAGEVDILIFDKTGTLTKGNRMAYELIPSLGVTEEEFHKACYYCCLEDHTPEGRSILELLKKKAPHCIQKAPPLSTFVHFSAYTRLSGMDIGTTSLRKGAVDAIEAFVKQKISGDLFYSITRICERGGTPLLVSSETKILGVIFLKDTLKKGLSEKFAKIRKMGIKTLLVTGDNPITAGAIAGESEIDKFEAHVSPEDKQRLMKERQSQGLVLGMTGDGVNDVLALTQADLAIAMHEGSQAAKEAANMIDLDSNPSKLYEIVQIGKQTVMTRGALTTFSIATDVSKYFIILPAILTARFPLLAPLNILQLSSPDNAIISAVIFNALILVALIPLAYKGVKFVPSTTAHILHRNLNIYGVGGIIFPFFGIKLIDTVLVLIGRF